MRKYFKRPLWAKQEVASKWGIRGTNFILQSCEEEIVHRFSTGDTK
jgi:hypothetical protein